MTPLNFRRYPRNSPQAAGRILATALIELCAEVIEADNEVHPDESLVLRAALVVPGSSADHVATAL